MDWTTHQVFNQFPELGDYDPLASDPALCEALARADAGWARPALDSYARRLGRADTYTLAQQANRHAPELHRFDTRGRRIDAIEFHPAWHQLMALYRGQGLVSLPFESSSRAAGLPGPPVFTCTARWSKARCARPP